MGKTMAYPHIFRPGRIGKMRTKNRLVMPPMVRNYASEDGLVTPRYLDHIARIAAGGVGTMILEASYVSPEGKGFKNELGVHSDAAIPGLRKLAAAAHRHGAKIGIQLYHAGRQTSSKTTGLPPVAPSPVADPTVGEVPKELDVAGIARLVAAYAAGARRAKAAGLDFVEIHGAHGYLITQFLSPFSNKRKDAYGGTPEKRLRFALEVLAAVRAEVGPDYPVTMRISGDEYVPGGLRLRDVQVIAKRLEAAGVDALHVSAGNYASYAQGIMIPPMAMPEAPLAPLAAGVKKAVKSVPVIAVAKIRKPEIAERLIAQGKADFVAVGRTLLADPDWPEKVRKGRLSEISRCVACNQGCISRLFAQEDVWCTVHPETGRERAFAKRPGTKKRVLVVGGGPAGLSAARTAAERGHEVTLYEKSGRLGGQLFPAAAAPHREGWRELREDLVAAVKRLKVDVRLKTEFVPAKFRGKKYDLAVVAIGSSPVRPNIPGIERTVTAISRDVLERPGLVKGRVVVLGGGCAGAQTAEFLAARGHKTTVVEMGKDFALDAPTDERFLLLGRLKKLGVKTFLETKATAIGSGSVEVEDKAGRRSLPADTVVLCLGSRPNDGLVAELKGVARRAVAVGDAKRAGRVTDAVTDGALAALSVG